MLTIPETPQLTKDGYTVSYLYLRLARYPIIVHCETLSFRARVVNQSLYLTTDEAISNVSSKQTLTYFSALSHFIGFAKEEGVTRIYLNRQYFQQVLGEKTLSTFVAQERFMPVTVKQAKFLWRYDNLVVSSAGFIWDSSAFNFNQSHRDLQGITACISILKNRNSTAF